MELINELKSLEDIVSKQDILIGKESRNLISEYSISSSQCTQDEISRIENDNRLLQIGIVGRVKAGKSSLLNALLFNGKPVLPKAATPMTAALTVISYGEELSAEVEFFSEEDIENIRRGSDNYKLERDRLLKEKMAKARQRTIEKPETLRHNQKDGTQKQKEEESQKDKLEKRVERELDKNEPSLSASYDQYQRIKASGVDLQNLENSKVIPFDTLESLGDNLAEYVGSSGKYMPFTKSVHIRIPQDNLKNIQIVDTPGVNDPVVSREERTRGLLKFCDVVFIVSPAGQFMSNEDLELMDRITSKEGVREIFVIASKCDTQLYGSVKESSDGDLHKAFSSITTDLADSLHATLSNLKKTNPEIGDAYDKLIEQSKESIIHSSGISLTIKESYDNQADLDEGEAHAWGLLIENYPDYFSRTDKKLAIPHLELLSNMEVINKAISEVRDKKIDILTKRKNAFLKAKMTSLNKYKNELLRFIDLQIVAINDGGIDELKAIRKKLNHIKLSASGLLDEEYYELVDELQTNMRSNLKKELKSYFKEAKGDIGDAEKTETERHEVYVGRGGFLWLKKKYETEYREITTVRTGAVKSSLSDLTFEIESGIENISDGTVSSWKKSLTPALLGVLRDHADDEDLNPSQIRKVVRNVINRVEFPSLSYQDDFEEGGGVKNTPSTLGWLRPSSNSDLSGATGTLTGYRATDFIDAANAYVDSLKQRVFGDFKLYLESLISNLRSVEMSEEIFSEYDSQLEELERQIENKEVTLDEYGRLKFAITGVE